MGEMSRGAFLLVFGLVVACGNRSEPKKAPGSPTARAWTIEDARNYERGAGVPRDYERAAEIYAHLCAHGHADTAACDGLIQAIVAARGITYDPLEILRLAAVMCGRGDDVMCVLSGFLEALSVPPGERFERDTSAIEAASERVEAACDAGDGRACQGILDFSFGGGGGSSAEWTRRERNGTACRQGWVEACDGLVYELGHCDDGDRDADEIEVCERFHVDDWKSHDYDADKLDALTRLRDLCAAGDAPACEALPGKAIPDEELCAAKDYGACAALGCLGDDEAAAAARDHAARPDCDAAYRRAMRRWRHDVKVSPTDPGPPPIVADPMDRMWGRPSSPFRWVEFRAHGGRDRKAWPRLDAYNLGQQDVVELSICAYGYDEDGIQTARARLSSRTPVPVNGSVQLELATGNPAELPIETREVIVDYDLVRFDPDDPPIEDASRCPEQRPATDRGRGVVSIY